MTDQTIGFVIQPFSERDNARFNGIYKPAMEAAGLAAQRADINMEPDKIMPSAHPSIYQARMCVADISSDEPSIYYEIGYSRAHSKNIVFVCETPRKTSVPMGFPPIKHIPLEAETEGAYHKCAEQITEALKDRMKQRTVPDGAESNKTADIVENIQAADFAGAQEKLAGKLSTFENNTLRMIIRYFMRWEKPYKMSVIIENAEDASAMFDALRKLAELELLAMVNFPLSEVSLNPVLVKGYTPTPKARNLARDFPNKVQ